MPSERFLDLYLSESRDCVRRLTAGALALERGEPEALAEAFRAAHTLKGIAAAMGHRAVAEAAHAVEDRLSELRDGQRAADPVVIDELLRASDAMDSALSDDVVLTVGSAEEPAAARAATPWEPAPPAIAGAVSVVSARLAPDTPLKTARALQLVSSARREGGVVAVRPELPVEEFDGEFHVYLDGGADAAGLAARWRERSEVDAVQIRRPALPESATAAGERKHGRTVTLRVDRERLDRLAEGISELAVHFASPGNGANGGHERAAAVVGSLQRTILELRTVSVNIVHDRAARVVRDAARALKKEIDLEFVGGDIELDQAVLDAVTDPLMHLLRNAADHGIEAPSAREALGKPRRGRVRLEAVRERTNVRIMVSDDGRGVFMESVEAAAAARGLSLQDSSDEGLLRLLVQPGFTTASTVSDLSGRGVGLDAVGSQIRGLGGAIEMTTTQGQGTTFTLRVPFTLAIVHGLRVRVGVDEYALPLTHIAEIAMLGAGLVTRDGEREFVIVRGTPVPLTRLRCLLGAEPSGLETAAVIAELGERRLALAVDEVLEHEPIVVKTFDAPLGAPAIFSGATLRADGRPLLLLDPLSTG